MTRPTSDRARVQLTSIANASEVLRSLLLDAPVGLAIWTVAGEPLFANPALLELFGLSPMSDASQLQQELLTRVKSAFQRALDGEVSEAPTFWHEPETTSARRRALSITVFPLYGGDGALLGVAASCRDETESAAVTERLRASEERLRLAQHVTRTGTFELNLRTGVNVWTPELEAMYGLPSGAFGKTQTSWENLVHPEDRARAIEHVNRAFETFMPVEGEWRVVWPDGTIRWIAGRFQVLKDGAGNSERLIGVNFDITERKNAEAALRRTEALKAAVVESALDAIVLMDHEGRITEFNPAAEQMFGYSRGEVIGRALADMLVPTSLRAKHQSGLQRYLATGEERVLGRRIEMPAMRRDGSEFPVELAIVRIGSEGPPMFTGYIRDLTERQQAAAATLLRREKETVQAAHRELEAFSYSVAHDLRGPLRAISGFTGAFLEDYGDALDDAAKEPLLRVVASVERMGRMIEALLALARLSRTEPHRQTFDLSRAAGTVVDQLRAAEPGRNVQVEITEGMTARADPHLVSVVLENLIGNAWKFTRNRRDARIEIGCSVAAATRSYYVSDNGAGFDMAYAGQLFTPFRRLHSTDQFEGTGIGLATVARIVERHGGRIWAEAKENEGATFSFTLSEPRDAGGL